jgi:hypothetical protein
VKRVLIVVNKWWECDPVVNVLLHEKSRPKGMLGWPLSSKLRHPRPRPAQEPLPAEDLAPAPRAVYALEHAWVEVWCVSDLLEHQPDKTQYQSSTERKAEQLPRLFIGEAPALVVAVGTAGYPGDADVNGCVVVGTGVFIHNGHPGGTNPDSNWEGGPFDRLLPSRLGEAEFARLTSFDDKINTRLIAPPNRPAAKLEVMARADFVSLGTVNVTDYKEYATKDEETLRAFAESGAGGSPASLETTHGLIRVQSDAPFLSVSGVPNRVGRFDQEVAPNEYAQNTAAAHNAGVVVAAMIPLIDQYLA